MKPSLIISRSGPEPHFEVHFRDRVEFWSLTGVKLGESTVHPT